MIGDIHCAMTTYVPVSVSRNIKGGPRKPFAERGVAYSPVSSANSIAGAAVLVFRDPDNIQLDLFFDPSETAP